MTDSVSLKPGGLYSSSGRIVLSQLPSSVGYSGQRTCLGWFRANGSNYLHVKTNVGGSVNQMHKVEYDGYTYSSLNVHNSATFYTYHGTATPHSPSLVNWGETTGGIVNYYYSSDDYVIIVLQTSTAYTGGMLYHQSGSTHVNHSIDVLAHSSSNNLSGVY